MRRLLGALLIAAWPASAQVAMVGAPCKITDGSCAGTFARLPAPAGCASGYVPYFDADLDLVCAPTVWNPTTRSLDVTDGRVQAGNLRAISLPASGSVTVTPVLSKVGAITVVAGSALADGDALSVGDGTGIVPIEFDAAPGDGTSGGAVAIVFDGTETATEIRDAVKAILDGATRDWTTSAQGADGIGLVRATPGATGGAITESVTNAGFTVTDWTDPTHATTYTYSLQACYADGTCNAAGPASTTTTGNATLSATNFNRLSWSDVPGSALYKIRRDVGGATQGVIWSGTTLTVDDAGLAGDGSAKPTVDGTGTLTGRGVLARGSTVAMGSGTATASLAGTLYVTTTPATTTGTTEQTLATYPMPANTMATNGRGVRITASFTHAANGNSTIAYVKFGGQQVAVRSNATSGSTTRITAEVIRTGPATQWSSALATFNATGQALSGALTVDLSQTVNITATATTGTAAGDLTLDFFMVEAI